MALDYQTIVDTLRIALCSVADGELELFRLAVADYAAACDEVNQRLNKCGGLLRKGLRSEAIRLAEIEPNLIEVATLLDFPERPELAALCNRFGLVVPTLNIEVAAELNEAYAIEQPLKQLLRRHRLLAMARAPLRQRIQTLRKLTQLDFNNPVWREDLQVFEKERLRQLEDELSRAARGKDLAAVEAVMEELDSDGWTEPPDPGLLKFALGVRQQLVREHARRELETIEPQLNAAFSSFDVKLGRALRARWQENAARCGLAADDPLAQRAEPALDWLRQVDEQEARQQARQRAAAALEHALNKQKPLWALEKLYYEATRDGHQLSPELEARYRSRCANLELAAQRRRRIIVAAIAGLSMVLLVAVGARLFVIVGNRILEGACERIEASYEQGEYPAGLKVIEELPWWVPLNRDIVAWKAKLMKACEIEEEREKEFNESLQRVYKFLASDEVNQVNVHQKKSELDSAAASLETARKLAQKAPRAEDRQQEDLKVREAHQKLEAIRREVQRVLDELFADGLDEFRKKLKAQEEASVPGNVEECFSREKQIAAIRHDLDNYEAQHPDASEQAKKLAEPLKAQAKALRDKLSQFQQELSHVEGLGRLIGSPSEYAAELRTYCQSRSGSLRAVDYQQVLKEEPYWNEKILSWNQLAQFWNGRDGWGAAEAGEAVRRLEQALSELDAFPEASSLAEASAHLERIAARKPQREYLRKWLSHEFLTSLFMIQHKNGTRHYSKRQLNPPATGVRGERVIVDYSGTERLIVPEWDFIVYNGPAPHNELVDALKRSLGQLREDTWEETFCEMIRQICSHQAARAKAGQPAADPIVLLLLLNNVLDTGCRGSEALWRVFASWRQRLDDRAIQSALSANWLDPADEQAAADRSQAEQLLAGLPSLEQTIKTAMEHRQRFVGLRLSTYQWVGIIDRSPEGTLHSHKAGPWQCRFKPNLSPASGSLWVAYAMPGSGKMGFTRIGQVVNGTVSLDPARSALLVYGRPLFLSTTTQADSRQ